MGGRQLLAITFCSAFIALPSTAKAYSWWSGWDSYAECKDYYTKNPPTAGCVWNGGGAQCYPASTAEQMCADKKAEENEKRREQEKTYRIIVLSCRADSVSEELATAR
jgi:hypothetical protein